MSFMKPMLNASIKIHGALEMGKPTPDLDPELKWLDEAIRAKPAIKLNASNLRNFLNTHFSEFLSDNSKYLPDYPSRSMPQNPTKMSPSSSSGMSSLLDQIPSKPSILPSNPVTVAVGLAMEITNIESKNSNETVANVLLKSRNQAIKDISKITPEKTRRLLPLADKFEKCSLEIIEKLKLIIFDDNAVARGLNDSSVIYTHKAKLMSAVLDHWEYLNGILNEMTVVYFRFTVETAHRTIQNRILLCFESLEKFITAYQLPPRELNSQLNSIIFSVTESELPSLIALVKEKTSSSDETISSIVLSDDPVQNQTLRFTASLVQSEPNIELLIEFGKVRGQLMSVLKEGQPVLIKLKKPYRAAPKYDCSKLDLYIYQFDLLYDRLKKIHFDKKSPEKQAAISKAERLSKTSGQVVLPDQHIGTDREETRVYGLLSKVKEMFDLDENGALIPDEVSPFIGNVSCFCSPRVVKCFFAFSFFLAQSLSEDGSPSSRNARSIMADIYAWRRILRAIKTYWIAALDSEISACLDLLVIYASKADPLMSIRSKPMETECINMGAFFTRQERSLYKMWLYVRCYRLVEEIKSLVSSNAPVEEILHAKMRFSNYFMALLYENCPAIRIQALSFLKNQIVIFENSAGQSEETAPNDQPRSSKITMIAERSRDEKSNNKYSVLPLTESDFLPLISFYLSDVRPDLIKQSQSSRLNPPISLLVMNNGETVRAEQVSSIVPLSSFILFPIISILFSSHFGLLDQDDN